MKIPYLLQSFFTTLLTGQKNTEDIPDSVKRRIDSLSQDAIFCTSRGKVKPSKHLCVGLSIKSPTGSRKVVEILIHMGHSISYHTAESMETEVASDITEKGRLLPDILLNQIGLATGLAWNNYDELTETLSGKNTLHDTVGICYQNKPAETVMEQTTSEPAVSTESSQKEDDSLRHQTLTRHCIHQI